MQAGQIPQKRYYIQMFNDIPTQNIFIVAMGIDIIYLQPMDAQKIKHSPEQ